MSNCCSGFPRRAATPGRRGNGRSRCPQHCADWSRPLRSAPSGLSLSPRCQLGRRIAMEAPAGRTSSWKSATLRADGTPASS
eukprot:5009780-Alexandrium_andersonii.AAC.1